MKGEGGVYGVNMDVVVFSKNVEDSCDKGLEVCSVI